MDWAKPWALTWKVAANKKMILSFIARQNVLLVEYRSLLLRCTGSGLLFLSSWFSKKTYPGTGELQSAFCITLCWFWFNE
jgi:hypothetical protein